jgi:hypothetical protein
MGGRSRSIEQFQAAAGISRGSAQKYLAKFTAEAAPREPGERLAQ